MNIDFFALVLRPAASVGLKNLLQEDRPQEVGAECWQLENV